MKNWNCAITDCYRNAGFYPARTRKTEDGRACFETMEEYNEWRVKKLLG